MLFILEPHCLPCLVPPTSEGLLNNSPYVSLPFHAVGAQRIEQGKEYFLWGGRVQVGIERVKEAFTEEVTFELGLER